MIGRRYSKGRNRNRFGSIVGLFSLIGMAIGVAALIVVLSVMNGFRNEFAGRLQTVSPDLTLMPTDSSADTNTLAQFLDAEVPEVIAKSPVLESFVMLNSNGVQHPMKLIGIDPASDGEVAELSEQLIGGRLASLQSDEFGILLGSYAANNLMVRLGDQVTLTLPKLSVTPAGLFPRQKRFRVVGVFDSGSQLDADYAYTHVSDLSKVIAVPEDRLGWRIQLEDVDQAERVADKISAIWGEGWSAQTWAGDYQSLFQAMKMEKITVGALLMIIVLVAAFNIVSGLVMMVSDKRSDMAVLRTMGASSKTVVGVFIVQGLILGMTGIALGAFFGTIIAYFLPQIVAWFEWFFGAYLFDPSVYYIGFLPSEWRMTDVLWILFWASILTLVATVIPAFQAAKISPREALNYKQ